MAKIAFTAAEVATKAAYTKVVAVVVSIAVKCRGRDRGQGDEDCGHDQFHGHQDWSHNRDHNARGCGRGHGLHSGQNPG